MRILILNGHDKFGNGGTVSKIYGTEEQLTRDFSNYLKIELDRVGNETTIYVFDNELTSKEVYILCLGVSLGWYKKSMDDVTQFKLHLSTKNFKSYSEQQNLQRRLERLGAMEEELSEAIQQYQLNNLDKLPFFGGA